MRLVPCNGGDALHEVEDAFGRAAFLGPYRFDDAGCIGPGEVAPKQEVGAILVGARDGPLARRLDALTKGVGDELAKFMSAGAASCANRLAAYFECRIEISLKSSTPHRF